MGLIPEVIFLVCWFRTTRFVFIIFFLLRQYCMFNCTPSCLGNVHERQNDFSSKTTRSNASENAFAHHTHHDRRRRVVLGRDVTAHYCRILLLLLLFSPLTPSLVTNVNLSARRIYAKFTAGSRPFIIIY